MRWELPAIWLASPTYTVYPAEAARQKPSVGAVVHPSLERIVALHPDLVLALPEFNGAETIAGLQRLGIPVFLFNTRDLSQHLSDSIASVGRVLGRDREAAALLATCARARASVRAQSAEHRQAHRCCWFCPSIR